MFLIMCVGCSRCELCYGQSLQDWASIAKALYESGLGEPALEKLKAFFGASAGPLPEKVKLDFWDEANKKETFVWRPQSEYLHDSFRRIGKNIHDFSISFIDKDGDELKLEYSKMDIEEMFKSIQAPARLSVRWQAPSLQQRACGTASVVRSKVSDGVREAIHWITGGGKASEADVKSMQDMVEQKGGRIVPHMNGASLINHKGYHVDKWAEACKYLGKELKLSEEETEGLIAAQYRDEGQGVHFQDIVERGVRRTRYIAYRTVREDAKLHIIYGRHELSMEAMESGAAFPMQNCIKLGARTFTVLPPASPHMHGVGSEMDGRPFDVPSGWTISNASADGFAALARDVIGAYYWHTDYIVASGSKGWPAWTTRNQNRPGEGAVSDLHWFSCDEERKTCQFTSRSARVLIEQTQHTSFDLLKDWKRYVQLSAQVDWTSRLGPPSEEL